MSHRDREAAAIAAGQIQTHNWGRLPWPNNVREALTDDAPEFEPVRRCLSCHVPWRKHIDTEGCLSHCRRCNTTTTRQGSAFDLQICGPCWNAGYRINDQDVLEQRKDAG